MIAINSIIDKIVKKEDISSNNLNIFFLQCLGYTSDIKIYKECILDNAKRILKRSFFLYSYKNPAPKLAFVFLSF